MGNRTTVAAGSVLVVALTFSTIEDAAKFDVAKEPHTEREPVRQIYKMTDTSVDSGGMVDTTLPLTIVGSGGVKYVAVFPS